MKKTGLNWCWVPGMAGIAVLNGNPKRKSAGGTTSSSKRAIPIFLVVLLFLMGTTVCGAIGNWRKKSTESAEKKDSKTSSSSSNNNNSDRNKTYLDLFGETAKDFLTRRAPERILHAFPATDSECHWDWRYLRCEPYCACSLRPKLPGDFHLGRACRVRDDPGSDEVYRDHCGSTATTTDPPPPPSIPSPLPFLERTSRGTWKVIKARADPVVSRAVGELETLHGRVRDVVCGDLKTRCYDDDDARSSSDVSVEVAWQERLFCGDMVRECHLSGKYQARSDGKD